MRGHGFAFALTLAIGLLAAGGASASYLPPTGDGPAAWIGGGSGQIVYTSIRQPQPVAGLRILDLNSNVERVSPTADQIGSDGRTVSPDGEWIAGPVRVGAGANAPVEFVAERFDGSERHVLEKPTTTPYGGFTWSPDSAELAFTANGGLFVVRPDGTQLVEIAKGTGPVAPGDFAAAPSWSPDGRQLAVLLTQSPASRELAVINADGTGLRTLGPFNRDRIWSPDGRSIAGVAFVDNAWQIQVIDVATGTLRTYPTAYTVSQSPDLLSWAADSSALIYSEDYLSEETPPPVYRINMSTGQQTIVVAAGYDASYSPDGSKILFNAPGDCSSSGNYVVPTAGGTPTRITNTCDGPPPLRVSLLAGMSYGVGYFLGGTAPTSEVTLRFSGACGEKTPASIPATAGGLGGWQGPGLWQYGFIPCRNGTVTVSSGSNTVTGAFSVRPRVTLNRLTPTRYRLTVTTAERLRVKPVVQVRTDAGTWRNIRTLTLAAPHRRKAGLVAQQTFTMRIAKPAALVRIFVPATPTYANATSNTV